MYELWYRAQSHEHYIIRDTLTNRGYRIGPEDIRYWDGLGWQWTPNTPNRWNAIKLFEFESLDTIEKQYPKLFI